VDSFKLFDKVNAMTGGGPGFATETMSTYVYRYIAETDGLARAAAGSVIMLLIAFVLSAVHAWRILNDREGSYA
jgi:multiple sugar transport system permease protein